MLSKEEIKKIIAEAQAEQEAKNKSEISVETKTEDENFVFPDDLEKIG